MIKPYTHLGVALFQPDMPPNTGAIMRLCACLGAELDIIGPCGFALDDKKLKRAALDYGAHLTYRVHAAWEKFLSETRNRRLILLTTKAANPYNCFDFKRDDIIVMGRESAGVPDYVHERADARLLIPMQPGARSLNVGMAAAIVLAEALRQTQGLAGA